MQRRVPYTEVIGRFYTIETHYASGRTWASICCSFMRPQYKDGHKTHYASTVDELCSILRLKRRTTDDSSSRRIMRLDSCALPRPQALIKNFMRVTI
jgi:hypothetical protein